MDRQKPLIMKKHTLLFISLLLVNLCGYGQKTYFQQDVAYRIEVSLDDQRHLLSGFERISYVNNSPDTLPFVFFHVWPNAYTDQGSAFATQKREEGSLKYHDSKPEQRGGLDSLHFLVAGAEPTAVTTHEGHPDILRLELAKPILPGQTVEITTPFRVRIPASFSRLGHIDQQYQICQWYPKPAVYDKYGWHPIPYLDQGEFYSEFGTFDVYITLPRNYVVGATGDLPAGDPEIAWLDEREQKSREMLTKKLEESIWVPEFPAEETKTLHFHQERVHDFAWFCDKNYYVLADTVNLPASKRPVRCVSMFTNLDRELWAHGPEYVAKAVYHYSLWNGDYPYNHATAVDGALSAGAGMEYPNITVLGAGGSASNLEMVTMHEVGHNWYYGILGSNEREYPWMDEGLNTFFEGRYWKELHDDKMDMIPAALQERLGLDFTHTFMAQEGYRLSAAQNMDQPVQTHAAAYTSMNYGVIAYMKTGLSFNYLEDYLGRETIDKCFHAYYERWKFRHPYPEDIQAVFEEVSGQDLGWFFDSYITGVHKVDFKIAKREGNTFTIRNGAGTPLPASLSLLDDEGKAIATYWTAPFLKDTTITVNESGYAAAKVNDNGQIPELDEADNLWRPGLFHHRRPVALDFLYKFPTPDKFHLGLAPTIGYNTTDGFMGGIVLYHNLFPEKPFSFHAMPMFGFKSSHLVGSVGATYRWLPGKAFRKIELQVRASSYSDFLRVRPTLTFHLDKGRDRSPFAHSVALGLQVLARRPDEGALAPADWYMPVYGSARWNTQAKGGLANWTLQGEVGTNVSEQLVRLSVESAYSRRILKKLRGTVRVFGGAIASPDPAPWLLQYRVAGSGDPFGEQILFDRAAQTTWLSHQLTRDHGGFSSLVGTTTGSYDRLLLSVNGGLRLPGKFLSVFGDYAWGTNMSLVHGSHYDAGLRINILQDALHINFPLVTSGWGGLPQTGRIFWQGVNFSFEPMRALRGVGNGIISF